jgi:uncharacterized protein YjbI with pentapeptide repeats
VRRASQADLTEKSSTLVVPPPGVPVPEIYTFLNCSDLSPNGSVEIICPPSAPEAWRKRLAVLAAIDQNKAALREILSFADLSGADLRDVRVSAELGQVDLSHASLEDADLSLAVMNNVSMVGTSLRKANLHSIHMTGAKLHSARFDGANLASARLIGSHFNNSFLREADLSRVLADKVDFSESDLSGANMKLGSFEGCCFDGAVLTGANTDGAWFDGSTFKGAILTGLDFSRAHWNGAVIEGAIIDPQDHFETPIIPDIHRAIYEVVRVPGAFNMGTWHTCETTHCRAGWTVTLAGEAGAALEDKLGTSTAATLIYLASDPSLTRIPDFHASDDEAMADMKRLAEIPLT